MRATPAADGSNCCTSPRSGGLNPGRPSGTGGMTVTPLDTRSKAETARIPPTTATSAPGIRGEKRRSARRRAIVATLSTTVAPFASPSCCNADRTSWKKVSPVTDTPSSFPSWLAAITRPVPILNPVRIGSEMKSARKPSLKTPATSKKQPTSTARVAAAVAASVAVVATPAMAVAVRMANVDVVETLSARDVPRTEYTNMGTNAT